MGQRYWLSDPWHRHLSFGGVKYKQDRKSRSDISLVFHSIKTNLAERGDTRAGGSIKNYHLLNSFRDNSEAAIKYLKAESCRKGKKENSRSKRRKKCEKTKQPFRPSAETDKHTSRKQQYQKRANDPNSKYL